MPVSTRVVTGTMPADLLYHSLPYSLRQGFSMNPELGPVFADPSTRVLCTVQTLPTFYVDNGNLGPLAYASSPLIQ